MERTFAIDGITAVELIVARAADAIRKLWDGGNERVAVITRVDQPGPHGDARVGFVPRATLTAELRRQALLENPGAAARLRELADGLAVGAPASGGVQCVLLGYGDPMCVEIEAEDLRSGVAAQPVSNEDLAELLDLCATQAGALREVGLLRLRFRGELGEESEELAALERVLEEEWSNVSAVALAVARARAATEAVLPTAVGQRVRVFLGMLGEATAGRSAGGVNSPGGAA